VVNLTKTSVIQFTQSSGVMVIEHLIGNDVEGNNRDLTDGIIPVFVWRD
jgi:hypothetical protein